MTTPTSVDDDLDDLLGVGPEDMKSAKPAAPVEEPADEPDEDDEPETAAPEPVAAEAPKKRTRRTKEQIAADNAAKAAAEAAASVGTMTEGQAQEAYLAELRAKLAGPTLKPEANLTPIEREIREAEDLLAKKTVEVLATAEPQFEAPKEGAQTLLIHIVNDGLPINGQMTYRGQEFEFDLDGLAYQQTLDRNGNTFLSLVDDIDGQYEKWGEQKIARGPWRGKRGGYTLKDAPSDLKADEKNQWLADMNAHAAAEARRSRAAPVRLNA